MIVMYVLPEMCLSIHFLLVRLRLDSLDHPRSLFML